MIIKYIYHALINALSAHMIFYTHVEHSPTKRIYVKRAHTHTHTYMHARMHTQ